MEEEKYVQNLRTSYETYKEAKEKELQEVNDQNERLVNKLAFYMFEHHLVSGTLSAKIKEQYDMRNFENTRLRDIMSLKDKMLSYGELPVEIKMMIEEMVI